MRFRKRTKIFPGVYLNFSKSGISTTIGVPGASVNIGSKGTYLNTGIPGTGLYDRQKIGGGNGRNQTKSQSDKNLPYKLNFTEENRAIKSDEAETITTEGLHELKKTLLNCYEERSMLKAEIDKAKTNLTIANLLMVFSYLLIFGIFSKWFKENRSTIKEVLDDLKTQLEDCFINIDLNIDDQIGDKYQSLLINYRRLLTAEKIWDITTTVAVDRTSSRSAASSQVARRAVKFGFGNIDAIKSKYDGLHFENANGGDLYIYPAFMIIIDSDQKFGLLDIRELDFSFQSQRFLEEEKVPKDASVIDKTWAKVNKNGTRDRRFKENFEIPICKYGELNISSATGLNESYSVSSFDKAESFAKSMLDYQEIIK